MTVPRWLPTSIRSLAHSTLSTVFPFSIHRQQIIGHLGPNGADATTFPGYFQRLRTSIAVA